jgi:hypothetical protein
MDATNLPFTREQFLGMFAGYNEAVWPLHVLAYALGLAAVGLVVRRTRASDRLVAGILAAFWVWLGMVFLGIFQRTIDTGPGPIVFATAFVLQGALFVFVGVVRNQLHFSAAITPFSAIGGAFIVYSMLVYPLLGVLSGHVYPRQPMFGVAPCPTVIFTFGLLLLTATRVPKYLLAVPLAWSVISGLSAPLNFGIYEDFGLLFAGVVGTALLWWRDHRGVAAAALQPRLV